MCSCGKRSTPRTTTLRPSVGPRPITQNNALAPAQIRALGLQTNVSLNETRRMDEQMQLAAKARRQAIQLRLNK